jgi:hypothetical protein
MVYCSTKYWILNPKCSNIFWDCFGLIFKLNFGSSFTKTSICVTQKMKNEFFMQKKWKLPSATLFVIPSCVVCRFHVATGWRCANKLSLTAPLLEHHTASGHHLQSFVSLLLDWQPWFHNWGKTCCYIHPNLLLGFSNWPVIFTSSTRPHQKGMWALSFSLWTLR